ncbi:MAG: sigma-54-dependent Fis family transcriptional regulator [Chitinophagaceae bacterium]|nr:sigma-54-dependent Fis family transcriptional regulator [Chitinophagaceae bacterium]MBN8668656.1 sigma-54-dependent Fis family transcriptional regulator [Chitinophagales bacterium]
MSKKILIIDDDADLCLLLVRFLEKHDFEIRTAYSGNKGLALFQAERFDAVICDYRLGDMDGCKLVSGLKEHDPDAAILMITGYSNVKVAVEVIKMGAFDYLTKPLIQDEVLEKLGQLIGDHTNGRDTLVKSQTEKRRSAEASTGKFFQGKSRAAQKLQKEVELVAGTNYSVILYGESGTGKEVMARTIHDHSPRAGKPFVPLDCGTLSRELAGSELFGHVKGAFTGALFDKAGHFELADGGTLFLDEIGNLPLDVQAVLLRVIQERKFKRIGGNKLQEVDVRIIVASNEILKEACSRGRFREDLYHRFNEFSISIPPLRERKDDIEPLAYYFLDECCSDTEKEIPGFSQEVLDFFHTYPWPGNIREFRNVVRRTVLLTPSGDFIQLAALPVEMRNGQSSNLPPSLDKELSNNGNGAGELLSTVVSRAEFELITEVLRQVNFNKKKAAEILKIDRKTLYNKLRHFESLDMRIQ